MRHYSFLIDHALAGAITYSERFRNPFTKKPPKGADLRVVPAQFRGLVALLGQAQQYPERFKNGCSEAGCNSIAEAMETIVLTALHQHKICPESWTALEFYSRWRFGQLQP